MNALYALIILISIARASGEPTPPAADVQPVCAAHGPLHAIDQYVFRSRLAGLPICPTDGSHEAAGAEILSFEEWKALQLQLQQEQSNGSSSPSPTTTASANDTASTSAESADVPLEPSPTSAESAVPSTKTPSLKDRYNFASTDCSARITSAHRGAKSPDSILSHKKDRYMLSPCHAKDQHVVVELCDDIRIDTVQLANFEFFSGVFRKFAVGVSVDGVEWEHAGEYEAKNVRGVQSFHPPQDLPSFYRYLRIDFASHYGNEFYCPVSLLRVYGLTQMEKFKRELAEEQGRSPASPTVVAVSDATPEQPTSAPDASDIKTAAEESTTASDSTRGTSDVALRPSIELFDLDKCATTTFTTSSRLSAPTSPAAPRTTDRTTSSSFTASVVESTTTSAPASPAPGSPSPSSSKPAASSPPAAPKATLTPGDSIYRTITNRLTQLEANSTLVMRFVEQQTLSIREALRRLEEDVGRLDGITKAQQTLFARTLSELERERRALDEERMLLLRKVASLSDEVVLEKRLGIAQLALLVAVLLFLAVTRGSSAMVAFPPARSRTSSSLFLPRPLVASDPRPEPPAPLSVSRPLQNPFPLQMPFPLSSQFRAGSNSRPRTPTLSKTPTLSNVSARLWRSNSGATGVPSPNSGSGRRLARTAHLHEVRTRTPRSGLVSPTPTPEPEGQDAWVTDESEREDEPLRGNGTWQVDESPLARRRRRSRGTGTSGGVAG